MNRIFYLELKSSSKFASGESLPKIFPILRNIIYFVKKILPHSPDVYSRDLLQAWQYLHRSSTRSQCLPFGMQDIKTEFETEYCTFLYILKYVRGGLKVILS